MYLFSYKENFPEKLDDFLKFIGNHIRYDWRTYLHTIFHTACLYINNAFN
jgi:hypothetical protein